MLNLTLKIGATLAGAFVGFTAVYLYFSSSPVEDARDIRQEGEGGKEGIEEELIDMISSFMFVR